MSSLKRDAQERMADYVQVSLETWRNGPTYAFRRHFRGETIFIDDIHDIDDARAFAAKLRLAGCDVRDSKAWK